MKLIIEEYAYQQHTEDTDIYKALKGSGVVNDIDLTSSGPLRLKYVGYLYNKECNDTIFFLPKVVLTGVKSTDNQGIEAAETVFGVSPEELINFDLGHKKSSQKVNSFLSELAVWIYRSISLYRKQNPDTEIVQTSTYHNDSKSNSRNKFHTLFDVVLALRDFNRDNKNYLTFVACCNHSGYNKIQWTKTINRTQVLLQEGAPVYINPINRKNEINFDEELLIFYYSILHHIKNHYGFNLDINFNYQLITGPKFKALCENGKGARKLKSIKYKYFSDKAIELWNLCYAYFDITHSIAIRQNIHDYMLVSNYDRIFEQMIDSLLGDQNVKSGLKKQKDGKRIDHIFEYDSLIHAEKDQQRMNTYYISDSKYYSRKELNALEMYKKEQEVGSNIDKSPEAKLGIKLHNTPIYKQYTYARNVIQWNLNLFFDNKADENDVRLRPDEVTEGYNVIPNFFISAYIPPKAKKQNEVIVDTLEHYDLDFNNDKLAPTQQIEYNRHFDNRLFDRDTLLLSYFDVNFLYIVSLYGRGRKSAQTTWREKVRAKFKEKVQERLDDLYEFYVLKPKNEYGESCIKAHFHELHGKIFKPNPQEDKYIMALLKSDVDSRKLLNSFNVSNKAYNESKIAIGILEDYFDYKKVNKVSEIETTVVQHSSDIVPSTALPKVWLPHYHLEALTSKIFIIGAYRSADFLKWIIEKNVYNIRLNNSRDGAQNRNFLKHHFPHFAILYEAGTEEQNNYRVFKLYMDSTLHEWDEAKMTEMGYPGKPHGKYAIYNIDEEIVLNPIDLWTLLSKHRIDQNVEYSPIFITGCNLQRFRKFKDKI